MTSQQLQAELEKFGLTTNQAKVYLLLVAHKELRIQEITKLADIPRSSVYECLKRLFELGIVEEIIEESYKKIRPYSIGVMHHGLDEQMMETKRLKQDLHELERSIELSAPDKTVGRAIVHYYKNRSGARQLFWNSLKATNMVYVMSDWGRARYVGMRYYENFVTESRRRKITERVLINPTKENLESIRQFTYPGSPIMRTPMESIRAIDESRLKITGDTLIYDDIYACVYLKNVEINGFEVESQQFVDTQRSIHEILWETAKPVKGLL